MQLSLLIGKKVLTPQGEGQGYVKGAYLTREMDALSSLCIVDGEEEEFFLPARAILSVKDAVIAAKRRLHAPTGIPAPIGLAAFSHTGEAMGSVCDWRDDPIPTIFLVKDGAEISFPAKRVRAMESAVVYPEGVPMPAPAAKKAQKEKGTPKPKEKNGAMSEAPMQNDGGMPEEEGVKAQNEPPMPAAPPKTDVRDMVHRDLLGRRVRRTVFDDLGVPVAKAGEPVTPAVLARARRSGRLVTLAANTLLPE